MEAEIIEYRGYLIELRHDDPMWELELIETVASLPAIPHYWKRISDADKQRAVAEAAVRIDSLLSAAGHQ
jgi:hypothetical protein